MISRRVITWHKITMLEGQFQPLPMNRIVPFHGQNTWNLMHVNCYFHYFYMTVNHIWDNLSLCGTITVTQLPLTVKAAQIRFYQSHVRVGRSLTLVTFSDYVLQTQTSSKVSYHGAKGKNVFKICLLSFNKHASTHTSIFTR